MTDATSFIRAIIANPADDHVRMIYADWCDENGQEERAAFIRSMIDYHRRPKPCHGHGSFKEHNGTPRLTPAMARRMRLWPWDNMKISTLNYRVSDRAFVLSGAWTHMEGADDLHAVRPRRALVVRGMVDELHLTTDDFLISVRSLFCEHPIRRIALTDQHPTGPIEGGPEMGGWFYSRRDLGNEVWYLLHPTLQGAFTKAQPSPELAESCLSDQLVEFGRKLAHPDLFD